MDDGVYEDERVVSCLSEPLWSRYSITTAVVSREAWIQPAKYAIQAALEREFGKCVSYSSAALQQAYLAAGRLEGFFSMGLGRHDYAAGLYLIRAAGGIISIFENGAWREANESIKEIAREEHRTIFASRPEIHDRGVQLIGDPKQWAS
jgi:fructose-1,6-bisphosphatase/inositol monophosphatase family enzyme